MPYEPCNDPRALLEARLAKQWPSYVASARSGVAQSRILWLENHTEPVDLHELEVLAKCYGCEIGDLVTYLWTPRPLAQSVDPNRTRFFAKGRPSDHAEVPEQSARRRVLRQSPVEDW